jgi:hypothetical protein
MNITLKVAASEHAATTPILQVAVTNSLWCFSCEHRLSCSSSAAPVKLLRSAAQAQTANYCLRSTFPLMLRLLLQQGRRAYPCVPLNGRHVAQALFSSGVLTRSMAPRSAIAESASSRSNVPGALMQKARLSASPAFSAEPDPLQPEIVSFKLTGET